MSKLDKAPFGIFDKVYWFCGKYCKDHKEAKREGVITDAYYQKKTATRKEGWRLLIRKEYIDGNNNYLEKNYNDVKRC